MQRRDFLKLIFGSGVIVTIPGAMASLVVDTMLKAEVMPVYDAGPSLEMVARGITWFPAVRTLADLPIKHATTPYFDHELNQRVLGREEVLDGDAVLVEEVETVFIRLGGEWHMFAGLGTREVT